MADNVLVDNGSGTDYTVASDDDGTSQHQYVKLEYGADGTFTKVGSGANAVPIQDGGNSITVDGTVTATASGDHTVVGKAADGAAVSGNPVLVAGQDGTNAQSIKTDTDGELQVDVLTLPNVTVNSHAVTNAGTFATQVDGAALTALQLIDDPVIADDAAFTPATTKVMMAGFEADETGTDSVDEGDGGAARMTLDRKVVVTNQPHAAGGCAIYRSIDLDEGTLEVVKASPGTLYGMWVTNTATATRFIKFYDATSGTAGTGTPVITIGIPGNSADDVAGAFGPAGVGIAFATGICFGAVTGVADNDTGAPGANEIIANVFYK